MRTICVIHANTGSDGRSAVLGAVNEEAARVKSAVQQYQKAIGPMDSRNAFAELVRQNKFTLVSCTPIDVSAL